MIEVENGGIPPLAGICSYEEAVRPGLTVEETVRRLHRYAYSLRRLHEIGAAHLPSTPEWEVKCALSLHLWLDAEHAGAIRARIGEMREPPHDLESAPDERLEAALEELIRARGTVELVAGVYAEARAALVRAIREHLDVMNPLFDHPTRRLLRTVLREQEEVLEWGLAAAAALTAGTGGQAQADAFRRHIAGSIAAAGGISGLDAPPGESEPLPARWDGSPFAMDAAPRRDGRFVDPLNATAKIDEYWLDESRPADERAWALAYKRLREMDVPEWMAPILYLTRGKPWEYYRDLARQLWDEARHSMMGEVALVALGVPFYAFPIDMQASLSLNLEYEPLEAHLILWRIEQGLMPRRTGKPFERSVAGLHGDALFSAIQDYDWADEVLHARIGRRWLKDAYPSQRELTEAADRLVARWLAGKPAYAERSTGVEWWPAFVERARRSGVRSV
jgi:hypothetical protein